MCVCVCVCVYTCIYVKKSAFGAIVSRICRYVAQPAASRPQLTYTYIPYKYVIYMCIYIYKERGPFRAIRYAVHLPLACPQLTYTYLQ